MFVEYEGLNLVGLRVECENTGTYTGTMGMSNGRKSAAKKYLLLIGRNTYYIGSEFIKTLQT